MWFEALEQRDYFSQIGLAAAVGVPVGQPQEFLTSADFNGDGKKDLVASSYSSSSLLLMMGTGEGEFGPSHKITLPAPDFVTSGDFNHDGKADLLCVGFVAGTASVLLGKGDGTFIASKSYSAGTGPRAGAMADFNGDGNQDLALAKSFDKTLTILYGQSTGGFSAPRNTPLSFAPSDVVSGDFNGDGKQDLAAADFFGDGLHVILNQGSGKFTAGAKIATNTGPSGIATGDLNHDGKLDLLTANFLGNDLSVLLGNGNGTFGAASNVPTGHGATFVEIHDFDADGNVDLLSVDANDDTISILLGNGNGTFQWRVTRATDSTPRSVILADFNADGVADVVAANQSAANVSLFLTDASRPDAAVNSAPPVGNSGGSTYDFKISYSDNIAMDPASLSNGDILVTSTNGFRQAAKLVSVSGKDQAQRIATYRITARGGFWKPADNATYSIRLQDSQVADSAGNFVPAARLGGFRVSAIDAGNAMSVAQSVGKLVSGQTRTAADYVGKEDRNDYFKFTLGRTTHVYGKLAGLRDDADLQLLTSTGGKIAYSKRAGRAIEYFDLDLTAGTYFARVLFINGTSGTGYQVRLQASPPLPPPSKDNSRAAARNLGSIASGAAVAVSEFVGTNDFADFFRFRLTTADTVSIQLTQLTGDADLELLDASGALVARSKHTGSANEAIKKKLVAGTNYYVRVTFAGSVRGTSYNLRLQA